MKSYQIYSNLAKIWAKFAKNLEFFFLKSKNGLPKSCLNETFYVLKGPEAKKAIRKSPGYFNQILTFESRKWSPVATFESKNNKSALSFFDFRLFHLQKQVLSQIVILQVCNNGFPCGATVLGWIISLNFVRILWDSGFK